MSGNHSPKIELLPIEKKWLDAITNIYLEVYRDKMNFSRSLGKAFVNKTYTWFCENSCSFGFIAIVDGNPAGFIVACEPDHRKKLNQYRFMTGLRQVVLRPWLLLSGSVINVLLDEAVKVFNKNKIRRVDFNNNDSLNLYSLAVLPKYSQNRISNLLLTECENHALKMNKRIIFCYISSQNRSSLLLHHLMGYSIDKMRSNENGMCFYKIIEKE